MSIMLHNQANGFHQLAAGHCFTHVHKKYQIANDHVKQCAYRKVIDII